MGQPVSQLAQLPLRTLVQALERAQPVGVFTVQLDAHPVLGFRVSGFEAGGINGLPGQLSAKVGEPGPGGQLAEGCTVGLERVGQARHPFGVGAPAAGFDHGHHFGRDPAGLAHLALGPAQLLAATTDEHGKGIRHGRPPPYVGIYYYKSELCVKLTVRKPPAQNEVKTRDRSRSYNSFAGSDVTAVIGNIPFAELQAISYSVTCEKAPATCNSKP